MRVGARMSEEGISPWVRMKLRRARPVGAMSSANRWYHSGIEWTKAVVARSNSRAAWFSAGGDRRIVVGPGGVRLGSNVRASDVPIVPLEIGAQALNPVREINVSGTITQ